jgi:hypothetical protein
VDVELIPRAIVAGLVLPPPISFPIPSGSLPGLPTVSQEALNRVWVDVVKVYPYQGLQLQPGGAGAIFTGGLPDQAVIIQPPLVQVRDVIELDMRQLAEKISFIFKTAAHHLGPAQPQGLGIKLIYNAPAPGRDAIKFLVSQVVQHDGDLESLAGGMSYDVGFKFVLQSPGVIYTLALEPLRADLSALFIDLDVQFSGVANLEDTKERIATVDSFMKTQVRSFLDRRAEGWVA